MMYVVVKARGELRKTLNQDFPSNYVLFNTSNPLLEVWSFIKAAKYPWGQQWQYWHDNACE